MARRNVSQSQMSLYLAGLYAAASLGPAAGFLLNGQFLNSWVSAGEEPPEGLSPSSPLWLGRWWLGYLLFCASCLVLIFPISCFPRYLPDTVEVRRAKLKVRRSRRRRLDLPQSIDPSIHPSQTKRRDSDSDLLLLPSRSYTRARSLWSTMRQVSRQPSIWRPRAGMSSRPGRREL